MRYKTILVLILIVLLFSGCIDNIKDRFQRVQVVYVNVSVASQDNKTVIQNITARGGEVSKLGAPGVILPEKFPAIYAEILQPPNVSKPDILSTISAPNGQDFKGPGNYSFTVQLIENKLNKSQQIFVYSEITTNRTRLARAGVKVNWTE